uniref:Uncharacterized protein n=1 Tax=Timema poppense TaxID=170557 RepID=A0A7R9H4G2_TIMPO|nr:unnamed protein product [Timema poppensis]
MQNRIEMSPLRWYICEESEGENTKDDVEYLSGGQETKKKIQSEEGRCWVERRHWRDELLNEKEKYKAIADEMDQTFADLSGY